MPLRVAFPRMRAVAVCAVIAIAPSAGSLASPPAPEVRDATKEPAALIERRAVQARESWWSWKPLSAAEPPTVRDAAWCRNPIDRFVLAKLEAKGIKPAPEATREALIRRATFDLTGLPPTPDEVRAFLADEREDAYERVVDRLLASPHYGEKWARHWLDLVRYADTNGFERDSDKPGAWKYRDWVVRAFNADMPYNQFVVEQLAGDELPSRTFDTLVATGYYRLGMWDDEVPDLQQALADDMDSIVDVTARTFLGIGLGCARCHDHKGDPIPQQDYYRFAAFFAGVKPYKVTPFNSIEADNVLRSVRKDFGQADPERERAEYAAKRTATIKTIDSIERSAGVGDVAGDASTIDRAPSAGLVAWFPFEDGRGAIAINAAGSVADDARDAGSSVASPSPSFTNASIRDAGFGAPGRFGHAFSFDGGDDRVEVRRPVQDNFTVSFWFRTTDVGGGTDSDRRWFLGKGLVDGEVPGIVRDWGISLIGSGFVAAGTGAPETFINSGPGYNDGAWHHVAFTRSRDTGSIELWVDGVRTSSATGSRDPLDAPEVIAIGTMKPDQRPFAGTIDEVRFYSRVLQADEVRSIATGLAPRAATQEAIAAQQPAALAQWQTLRNALEAMRPPESDGETVLAVREEAAPRECHVMIRGSPHALGDVVEPAVPLIAARFQPDFPAERPHGESSGRRLALARWIADGRNALAVRTLANRLWQHHFGVGICPTTNDLGKFGEAPTHAELLDWLAGQVVNHEWSLKQMHRLLMTSAAYRMSSVAAPDALAKDPSNELLSRFRMRRLAAEELRDGMLAAAGTLNEQMGGPGVRPPMPAEVLATSSRPEEVWPLSPEPSWTRRSLYIHLKRSLQHPLLAVFDLADVDAACPVRFATVQPTQALSMVNGALTNGIAADMARRLLREHPDDLRAQLAFARELTSARPPDALELREAEAFVEELRSRDGMTQEQALSAYCLVLFNLNEFLSID